MPGGWEGERNPVDGPSGSSKRALACSPFQKALLPIVEDRSTHEVTFASVVFVLSQVSKSRPGALRLVVGGEQRSYECNQTIQGQRDKPRRLQGKEEARAAARSRLA